MLRLPKTAALVKQVNKVRRAQKDRKAPLVLLALQEPLASKVHKAILESKDQKDRKVLKDCLVIQAPQELKDLLALLVPPEAQDLLGPKGIQALLELTDPLE